MNTDGTILVILRRENSDNSTKNYKIETYTFDNTNLVFDLNNTTSLSDNYDFGTSMSLNNNGTILVIGEGFIDIDMYDTYGYQSNVFVYTKNNTTNAWENRIELIIGSSFIINEFPINNPPNYLAINNNSVSINNTGNKIIIAAEIKYASHKTIYLYTFESDTNNSWSLSNTYNTNLSFDRKFITTDENCDTLILCIQPNSIYKNYKFYLYENNEGTWQLNLEKSPNYFESEHSIISIFLNDTGNKLYINMSGKINGIIIYKYYNLKWINNTDLYKFYPEFSTNKTINVGKNDILINVRGDTATGTGTVYAYKLKNKVFSNNICKTITWNGSKWFAGGSGDNYLSYSDDGINWTTNLNSNCSSFYNEINRINNTTTNATNLQSINGYGDKLIIYEKPSSYNIIDNSNIYTYIWDTSNSSWNKTDYVLTIYYTTNPYHIKDIKLNENGNQLSYQILEYENTNNTYSVAIHTYIYNNNNWESASTINLDTTNTTNYSFDISSDKLIIINSDTDTYHSSNIYIQRYESNSSIDGYGSWDKLLPENEIIIDPFNTYYSMKSRILSITGTNKIVFYINNINIINVPNKSYIYTYIYSSNQWQLKNKKVSNDYILIENLFVSNDGTKLFVKYNNTQYINDGIKTTIYTWINEKWIEIETKDRVFQSEEFPSYVSADYVSSFIFSMNYDMNTLVYSYSSFDSNSQYIITYKLGCKQINNIAWNGSLLIAGGSSSGGSSLNDNFGILLYSYNGTYWKRIADSHLLFTDKICNIIYWNFGKWVAGGKGTYNLSYSNNGIDWTQNQSHSFNTKCNDITWNGTYFIAVGDGNDNSNPKFFPLIYSSNGITWQNFSNSINLFENDDILSISSRFLPTNHNNISILTLKQLLLNSTDFDNFRLLISKL